MVVREGGGPLSGAFRQHRCIAPAMVAVVTLASCAPGDEDGTTKSYLSRFDGPLHICHQGGEDLYPTNTLYAFRRCVDHWNTDVLELDLHQTRDGHLVVLHDETVDRTTDGEGLVKEKTLDELRTLDAAFDFTREDGEGTPLRGRGLVIPTLEEVFTAFPNHLTNIEIKQVDPPIEENLADIVEQYSMAELTCLGSFNDEAAARLRELMPDACHYGPEGMARDYFIGSRVGITSFNPPPVDAFALPPVRDDITVIDPRLVESLQADGVHLWAWTIDDEDEMRRLLTMGVDGIMTNRPDRLDAVMRQMGLR